MSAVEKENIPPVDYSALQQKALSQPRSFRKRADNRTREQRRESAILARFRKQSLHDDLNNIWKDQDRQILELAIKHQKSAQYIRQYLQQTGRVRQKSRKVSKYNAYLHAQSLVINENLLPGEKHRLETLHNTAKGIKTWEEIPEKEMDGMIALVEEARLLKLKGSRSTTEGHLADVNATFRRVAGELTNLRQRCRISAVCVIVRTDGSQKNIPLYYADSNMADALETISSFTLDDLCMKAEAYSLFHLKGVAKNENDRKTLTKARVGILVRKGLRTISGDKNAEMSWAQFEQRIVQRYHVHLVGWPEGVQFDIHKLGTGPLGLILDALRDPDPTCYWEKLTDEQVKARKAQAAPKKPRKQRADKGKKRALRGTKRKRHTSPPTSGSESEREELSPQYVDDSDD